MKIGVISLGCSKNLVDTETALGLLVAAGHEICTDPEQAEALLVNTCGFIAPAKEESIEAILEAAQYKQTGACRMLIVTGCLSERYRSELPNELPEVDIWLGVREYDRLPALLAGSGQWSVVSGQCAPRILATPPWRAYLRIADGCDNRCAYCAIPGIRGPLQSEPMERLLNEAKRLADAGVTELSLIAQDTSGYGRDLYGEPRLIELLKALSGIGALRWIRLLYTYPDTVNPALLDTLAGRPNLVPYLDMPLQHINDNILRRMNRRGSKAEICALLDYLFARHPNFTLRTTAMVGFPGETDEQFSELLTFLSSYPFDRVGAFAFSPEEDTPAYTMPGQVPKALKQERLARLMEAQKGISQTRNRRHLGEETLMLIERLEDNQTVGRTLWHAPEVDGVVSIPRSPAHCVGGYVRVRITEADAYDMKGESLSNRE
ncbi:MAG: 30S ribosomal protein S12 methylthiotransferase RimO [Clostridiales bacterium]|nr:30S ribosomal protein S12 methylthiotransferase RimO [Clostridiales bacterium]